MGIDRGHTKIMYSLQNIIGNETKYKYSVCMSIVAILFVTGMYVLLLSLRTMPLPEGWYSYYADCILRGEFVYKDFEYLFPPLYIYFIAFFTKIFGMDFIALRLLGVAFFIIINILVYLILRELFTNYIAVIASITATLYLQTEVAQVFYDYVRFMDICALSATFFFLKFASSLDKSVHVRYLIYCGLSCSCFVLVKHNMGLIFMAYIVVALFGLYFLQWQMTWELLKKCLIHFFCAFGFVILVAGMSLWLTDGLSAFLQSGGAEALQAKGGAIAILFGWLWRFPSAIKRDLLLVGGWSILVIGSYYVSMKNEGGFCRIRPYESILAVGIFVSLTMGGLFLLTQKESFASVFEWHFYLSPYAIFGACSLLTGYLGWQVLHGDRRSGIKLLLLLLGAYFAISYGCGTSGGLAEGQAVIGLSVLLALPLDMANRQKTIMFSYAFVLGCILLSLQFMDRKMLHTYYWWESTASNFWTSTQYSTVPTLKGIRLSEATCHLYDGIYHDVVSSTNGEDRILCFPRIPGFYVMCQRWDPGVYCKVQWFDVAADIHLETDLEKINRNPPKMLILMDTSDTVCAMHEQLFRAGRMSMTRRMRDALMGLAEEQYTCLNVYDANTNRVSVWLRK